MPTYEMKAPDGNTYEIEGPEGATPEQVRAAIMRRNPNAGKAREATAEAQPKSEPSSLLGKVVGAVRSNPLLSSMGTVGSLPEAVEQTADAATGLRKGWDAGAQMLAQAVGGDEARRAMTGPMRVNMENMRAMTRADERPGSAFREGMGQGIAVPFGLPMKGAGLTRQLMSGAGLGAVGGILDPVYDENTPDFWSAKGEQGAKGAVGGTAMAAGLGLMGRVISPAFAEGSKALEALGVRQTIGQKMGGLLKNFEDKLTSYPILGNLIQDQRRTGIMDFNKAVYSKALEPFGREGAATVAAAPVGNEGVKKVGDFLSKKYDAALAISKPVPVTDEFRKSYETLLNLVPTSKRQDFENQIGSRYFGKTVNTQVPTGEMRDVMSKQTDVVPYNMPEAGSYRYKPKEPVMEDVTMITPSMAKQADSELKMLSREYRGSPNPDDRIYADALAEMASMIREQFARHNPQSAQMIRAADEGWATLVQLERAAGFLGAKDGVFTPQHFLNAVKHEDPRIRHRGFTRNEARNIDLARDAARVLPSEYPDSGTPGRIFASYLMAGGVHVANPALAVAGHTLAALPYLPGVGRGVTTALTSRPMGASTLRLLAEMGVPAGAVAGGAAAADY